jgi:hypothetical protein
MLGVLTASNLGLADPGPPADIPIRRSHHAGVSKAQKSCANRRRRLLPGSRPIGLRRATPMIHPSLRRPPVRSDRPKLPPPEPFDAGTNPGDPQATGALHAFREIVDSVGVSI